ncbi:MAG TPA: helix-turn-helix transcriptional regulator [Gammaproteobacteria bacterium]|nr:helix-turn-helix transcriptional regulator [Gammaproteobacteria bacterium]
MTGQIKRGSDNVFADLGVPDSEEALLKAQLAELISSTIEAEKLTQARAATILGIDQPKVSNLVRGKLEGFSLERLLRFLTALGSDVEIRVTEHLDKSSDCGHIKVAVG